MDREQGYVVLTHDSDFRDPEKRGAVPVVYYGDDTIDTDEIADRVDELISLAPQSGGFAPSDKSD